MRSSPSWGCDVISLYTLSGLVENRLKDKLGDKALVFAQQPPDEESRGRGYVIIDMLGGVMRYARADGPAEHDGQFQLRCCGSSAAQMRNTVDLVRAALVDWRPMVDLRYGPARESDAGPEILDRSVVRDPRWSMTLTYHIDDGDDYA